MGYNRSIVGFWCRYFLETEAPSSSMLFIHPDHMGKGLAKKLFKHIKQALIQKGVKHFTVETDPHAVSFYL